MTKIELPKYPRRGERHGDRQGPITKTELKQIRADAETWADNREKKFGSPHPMGRDYAIEFFVNAKCQEILDNRHRGESLRVRANRARWAAAYS